MFVVAIYVVGGDHDGENLAMGPFSTSDQAETERKKLPGEWDTSVLEMHFNSEALLKEVGE